MDTFSEMQRFHLHLITKDDVRKLAATRLSENHHFASALQDDRQGLIDCLVEYAKGVFCWVCLAVEELKLQLNERQSFDLNLLVEMTQKFPQDLNTFFKGMLAQIRDVDRSEAAAIFTIALALHGHDLQDDFNLFCYSMVGSCAATNGGLQHLSEVTMPQEAASRIEEFTLRLPGLCKGLLETRVSHSSSSTWMSKTLHPNADRTLNFVHRSVLDCFRDSPEAFAAMDPKANAFRAKNFIFQSLVKAFKIYEKPNIFGRSAFPGNVETVKDIIEYLSKNTANDTEEASAFPYLRMLEANLLRKQQVISREEPFDNSLESSNTSRLMPCAGSFCPVLRQAVMYSYVAYIDWAMKNYPPWFLSNECKSWFYQGLEMAEVRERHQFRGSPIRSLVTTNWFSMNDELPMGPDRGVIDDFPRLLSGSL